MTRMHTIHLKTIANSIPKSMSSLEWTHWSILKLMSFIPWMRSGKQKTWTKMPILKNGRHSCSLSKISIQKTIVKSHSKYNSSKIWTTIWWIVIKMKVMLIMKTIMNHLIIWMNRNRKSKWFLVEGMVVHNLSKHVVHLCYKNCL